MVEVQALCGNIYKFVLTFDDMGFSTLKRIQVISKRHSPRREMWIKFAAEVRNEPKYVVTSQGL